MVFLLVAAKMSALLRSEESPSVEPPWDLVEKKAPWAFIIDSLVESDLTLPCSPDPPLNEEEAEKLEELLLKP